MKRILLLVFLILLLFLPGCATPRPWTTAEKTLLIASCLAAAADTYTTIDGLSHGSRELNPIIGPYPSNERVITYMITSQALFILLAHYLPDYRVFALGFKTFLNTGCAIHNMGTH